MKTSTLNRILFTALKALGVLAFWLILWELAALRIGKELILPSPVQVFSLLFKMLFEKATWQKAGLSLLRIGIGYISGITLGVLLSLLTCRFKICDMFLSPVIRTVRATPVASFIILVMLWVNKGIVPGVMVLLMTAPLVWENICAQYRAADKKLIEMGRAYAFSHTKMLRLIYLPQCLPGFFSGCINSVGLAWKSGIAAEVLCQPNAAIGSELYFSKIYLETPSLFAWTAVVIILSFILEKLIRFLLNKLSKEREAAR